MKKLSLIAALIFIAAGTQAQAKKWLPNIKKPVADERIQTIVNPASSKGFYLSATMGAQVKEDQPFVKVGTSGAFVFDDKFGIGFAANGYTNDVELNPTSGRYIFAEGGYGGLLLEPIFFSNKRVHFSIPTVIGGGSSVVYEVDEANYWYPGERFYQADYSHRHNYLMVEPGVNMELNLTKFMRMGLTASYMLTTDLNQNQINVPELDGLQLGMNLRLGWF